MRISLPAGLLRWAVSGAALVLSSLLLISRYTGDPIHLFTFILVAFALWTAAGVEACFHIEILWQPPWNLLSIVVATGLPLVLILAAISQCLTLSTRGHFRTPSIGQQAHRIVMQDLAQNRGIRH